jgi:hypothetical protein
MEDIMELGADGKLQPIGDVPYLLEDEEGAIEFQPQLAAPLDIERSEQPVNQAEPNPLTDCEGDVVMLAVVEIFVLLLGLLQPFTHLHQELITILQLSLHRRYARLARRV